MKPSTTDRASRSRSLTRARTFGSTKRAPGTRWVSINRLWALGSGLSAFGFGVGFRLGPPRVAGSLEPGTFSPDPSSHSRSRERNGAEQLVNQRVARHSLRLGAEVGEHSVPQHGMGQ